MKFFYIRCVCIITFILWSISLFSNPIDQRLAQNIGLRFMKNVVNLATERAEVVPVYSGSFKSSNNQLQAYYVFNINDGAFVIVAADDRVKPILGYSLESGFDVDNIPSNMKVYLDDINEQIEFAVVNNVAVENQVVNQWSFLRSDAVQNEGFKKERGGIKPLLTSKWDQGRFFNDHCPVDSEGPNGHVYAGCVATTLAQILNYWEYPNNGTGKHTYTHPKYGQHSVDFGTVSYNYSLMPDEIKYKYNSSTQTYIPDDPTGVNAIASLIYDCGIAVNMDYGADGSGAFDVAARAALINHFGYNPYLSMAQKSFFSEEQWCRMLKNDLNAGRPIYYSGSGSGGHAFVCDGYDANDYFHFNWGWSGSYNGYFTLYALTPASGHNYSNNQVAFLNIVPMSVEMDFPPSAPSDFNATVGGDQMMNVTLNWTNPKYSMNGSSLNSLSSIVVKRNGNTIHTIQNPVIGGKVVWTDNSVPFSGNHVYEITALNENGQGISAYHKIPVGQMCNISVEMNDSYGDGWNGASIEFYSNDVLQASVSLVSGNSNTVQVLLPKGTISCYWVAADYDNECSFKIFDQNNAVLYASNGKPNPGKFYTFSNSCLRCQNESYSVFSDREHGKAINPENPIQQIFVHNIDGITTEKISSSALITHTLGFNQYSGTNYSNSFNNQMILYPENSGDQLLLEVLNRNDQTLLVYDGVGTEGPLLLEMRYGYASDFQPVMSTKGALTLKYQGNWRYLGFEVRVSTVSCLPMVLNFGCKQTEATTAFLGWDIFESSQWQSHEFNWQVEYGKEGFKKGTGTVVSATDAFAFISGLMPENKYEAYLYYNCATGSLNSIGPCYFKTNPISDCYESIGSGNITSNYYPIYSNSEYAFTQQIYTSDELNLTGLVKGDIINQIGFHYLGNFDQDMVYNDVIVYLGNTSKSFFGSSADSIKKENLQKVYSGRLIFQRAESDYWTELFFDEGFVYNGSNIVVAIEKPGNQTGYYYSFYAHNTVGNKAMKIDGYYPEISDSRSDIRFCAFKSCPIPSYLSASLSNEKSVVLSWIPGYEEKNWNVEYGVSGFKKGSGTMLRVNNVPEVVIDGLSMGVYDFYIQADCGDGDLSRWVSLLNEPVGMNCEAIGNGIATMSQLPIGYFNDSYYTYTQQIFRVEELKTMGLLSDAAIHSLSFQYVGNMSQTKDPIVVYLGNTTQNNFGEWIPISQLEEVFSGSVVLTNDGWVSINFSSPFIWDGKSNLVVAMLNNSGTENRTSNFYVHSTDENSSREHCQSSYINPLSLSYEGAAHNQRNNMRFCATNASCFAPQNISVVVNDDMVTLTWRDDSGASNWNLEYGPSGFLNGQGVKISVSGGVTKKELYGLSSGYYDFYVQTDCGDEQSLWKKYSNVAVGLDCDNSIGNGTIQNNTFPISFVYNYSYTQQIFTSEELVQNGLTRDDLLCSISFKYVGAGGGADQVNFTIDPVTVYLGNSTQSELNSWVPVADLNKVYSGPISITNISNDGWINIVFTEPYAWDGVSNLVLAMLNNSGSAKGGNNYFYMHETGKYRSREHCSSSSIDLNAIGSYGSTYTSRNNIRFCFSKSNCYSPQSIEIKNVTDVSAMLTWEQGGEESNWIVEYGVSGFIHGEGNVVNLSAPNYDLTGLVSNQVYDVYVRSDCGTETSVWKKITFRTLQTPALLPYVQNFEDDSENGNWHFENSSQNNKWFIGTGANNGGVSGLYVSGDGGLTNNCITGSMVYVYAYRPVNFIEGGNYTINYDWRNGVSNDRGYIRVFLVPAEIEINPDSDNGIRTGIYGTPEGWICADNQNALFASLSWQNFSKILNVPKAGVYNLVFYWYNYRRVDAAEGGAIDNISIKGICETPTGLKAIAENNNIKLTWNSISNGVTYNIFRGSDLIAENISVTYYTDENLFYGSRYCYRITSVKASCESESTDEVCIKTADSNFATPTGFNATASDNQITLTWNVVQGATNYTVYRDNVMIGTTVSTVYVDKDLQFDKEYCYVVTATGAPGTSSPTASVCVRTATCNPVRNLTAMVDNIKISLRWDVPDGVVYGIAGSYYRVYRDGDLLDSTSDLYFTDIVNHTGIYNYCVEYLSGNCNSEQICVSAEVKKLICGIPDLNLQNLSDDSGYKIAIQTQGVQGALAYKLYKDGVLYNEFDNIETAIVDNNILPGVECCYAISAICNFNNERVESEKSEPVCMVADCYKAPLLSGSVDGKIVSLSWKAEASSYDIYRNGVCITTSNHVETNFYKDAGTHLQEGVSYSYSVAARCSAGDPLFSNVFTAKIDPCSSTKTIDGTICEGETYNLYGFNETESGVYQQNFTTEHFCDSIVVLNLTVYPTGYYAYNDVVCQGSAYNKYGFDIPASSLQTPGAFSTQRSEITQFGCDSIIALNLMVNPVYEIAISDGICLGEGYNNNGFNFSADSFTSGGIYNYEHTFSTVAGCDSIVRLSLKVSEPVKTEMSLTVCDSYLWNNQTYYDSGSYEQKFVSVNGCDSTVVLYLTVLKSVKYEFSETVCGKFTWNDQIYEQSGVYTQMFMAANSCDSTVTLRLTVYPTYMIDLTETASESYVWNGITYTESGDYTQKFVSIHGCDSIVVLHLTINYPCEDPKNLKALTETNQVYLSWDASASAVYYDVLRDNVQIADSINVAYFLDEDVESDTQYCYKVRALCKRGESQWSEQLCVTTPVGVDVLSNRFSIYPNPARSVVYIESEQLKTVMIYNITGKLIKKIDVNGQSGLAIDVKNETEGLYIFRIITYGDLEFSKIITVKH